MPSVVWERDSAQESWWQCLPLSPQSNTPQFLLTQLVFILQSLGWVAANEILFIIPLRKQSPVFLWWTESPPIFAGRCYVGGSSLLWCSGLGRPIIKQSPCNVRNHMEGNLAVASSSTGVPTCCHCKALGGLKNCKVSSHIYKYNANLHYNEIN